MSYWDEPGAAVLVVGSVCVDYYRTANGAVVPCWGGKGANQALAAASCGTRVTMVGCVGDDRTGRLAADRLAAGGVDVSYLHTTDRATTGATLIAVGPRGESTITGYNGANAYCRADMVTRAVGQMPDRCLLLVQQEVGWQAVVAALTGGERRGWPVIIDPAPPRNWPDGYWRTAAAITPNQAEAFKLSGYWVKRAEDAVAAVAAIRARYRFAGDVIITARQHGLFYTDGPGVGHCPASLPADRVVDGTGAGDVCNGVLAAKLVAGCGWRASVEAAARAAELATTGLGAQVAAVYEHCARLAGQGKPAVVNCPAGSDRETGQILTRGKVGQ
ncbi:MAG: PfkB family carbohydrate kinase [Negativicutes bacterium]|nr:PfkB family carbohydrate kinase [Negativicutes bacterium]